MAKKNEIETKAEMVIDIYLKDYIEISDDESFKDTLPIIQKQVKKYRSTEDKIHFLESIISRLRYYKSQHQEVCPERKKGAFCQWEENYDETIYLVKKEKKQLILDQELLTFDEKIIRIFKDLATRLGREGDLEEVLKACDILYIKNDIKEFINYFKKTGFVNVTMISKDAQHIILNQSGLDFLKEKISEKKAKYQGNITQSSLETSINKKNPVESSPGNELEHPIVFISYSWDDDDHKNWVLQIANRLRNDGVDVILDRYHLRPGVNLSYFVENSLRTSNRILTILTPEYKNKADNRTGGVGQEYSIINTELIKNISKNERIIPVLRRGSANKSIPDFLKTYIYVNFTNDKEFENNYEELLREIYKTPEITPPELGSKPSFANDKKKTLSLTKENKSGIIEIRNVAKGLTKSRYNERKNKALKIYEISLNVPFSEILGLVNDKDLEMNIAAAISIKSITENHNLDLGTNPNIRQFVVSNFNNKNSFLRYRIFDYISVSEILQKDFKVEIERHLEDESNEEVISKINSILGIKPSKTEANKQSIKTRLQSLIIENQIKEALDLMIHYTKDHKGNMKNTVILLSSQFNQLERDTALGLISYSDVTLYRNQLMNKLLAIVNEI